MEVQRQDPQTKALLDKGNGKEQIWIYQPKNMVMYIDLRKYYICIKKYMEVWRQDPQTKALLSNLLHFKYCHNHEEWDQDLDNDEVEHVLPQYAKTILQTKDLEEQAL